MKSTDKTMVAQGNAVKQVGRILAVGFVGLQLIACSNYTTQAVCTEGNVTEVGGLTGTYTFSTQDSETFVVETETIEISAGKKRGTIVFRDGRGRDEEATVCFVNGRYVSETFDEEIGAYEQSHIYVTSMGISGAPVMYNKASMDEAGILSEIFVLPEEEEGEEGLFAARAGRFVKGFLGRVVRAAEESLGLRIDNSQVSPQDLLKHASTGPVSLNYYRK